MKRQFAGLAAAAAVAVALSLPATTHAQNGEWEFWTSFTTPEESAGVLRMAFDSQDNMYLTRSGPSRLYKSVDAIDQLFAGEQPTFETLFTDEDAVNGMMGLAVDSDDNVYAVADGDGTEGQEAVVAKFDADGDLVTDFGDNGLLAGGLDVRLVGAALTSDEATLIVHGTAGLLYSVDAATGAELVEEVDTEAGGVTRDIAVRPVDGGDDELYLNRSGRLYRVTGGSATDISGYDQVEALTPGLDEGDPGWAIRYSVSYFAADDVIIFSNIDSGVHVYDPVEDEIVQTITEFGTGTPLNEATGVTALHAVEDPDDGTLYDLLFVSQNGTALAVYRKALEVSVPDWDVLH